MGNDLEDRIRQRAYEIWEREGGAGDPEDLCEALKASSRVRVPTLPQPPGKERGAVLGSDGRYCLRARLPL
jgi:hypothetical protein